MTVPMAPEIDTEQEVILLKIERINENQIRCTLTSFDLSVRNLNLVELAYGTEKAPEAVPGDDPESLQRSRI